uniref:Uncharacterized protein n=1 Tax=viral metagenome TaxID=1070528 RepID=A0A6M3JRN6_9ZZZZ
MTDCDPAGAGRANGSTVKGEKMRYLIECHPEIVDTCAECPDRGTEKCSEHEYGDPSMLVPANPAAGEWKTDLSLAPRDGWVTRNHTVIRFATINIEVTP